MKARAKRQHGPAARRTRGVAIVEGACIMPVMVLSAVYLVFLMLNVSMTASYTYRINAIANEACKQYCAGLWWAGMERWQDVNGQSNFNQTAAEQDMLDLINAELEMLMPGHTMVNSIDCKVEKITVHGQESRVMRVAFDVPDLPICTAGLFPSKIKLKATGMACDAQYAQAKHGMASMLFMDPKDNDSRRGIRVPILNATDGHGHPADPKAVDPTAGADGESDPTVTGPWLRAGDTLGTPPTVRIFVYAKTTGNLHLESTDIAEHTTVGETRPWGLPETK